MEIKFNITDESFDLLNLVKIWGSAEYRDTEYASVDEFLMSDEYKTQLRTLEWFKRRNCSGTYYLINELLKYGLVESDMEAWHSTYVVSELGEEVLKNNKI